MTSEKQRIVALAEPVAAELGLEVLDVELAGSGGRRVLRVFLDSAEAGEAGADGISVANCEAMSRRFGDVLEAHDDPRGGSYMLEVSSPGVNRPLVKPAHFERVVGQRVRLRLHAASEGGRSVLGKLGAFDDDVLTVEIDARDTRRIRLAEIEKANLEYEFPTKARPGKRRRA